MDRMTQRLCAAIALALAALAAQANAPSPAGRTVYVTHCRTCHGGMGAPDLDIGPRLDGIVGAKAGTRAGGMYSRATIDSAIVWDRDKLRGFLSAPRREIPASVMPEIALQPSEMESLLDYLESLR